MRLLTALGVLNPVFSAIPKSSPNSAAAKSSVLLGQLAPKLLHTLRGKYRGFKLTLGIGNIIKQLTVDACAVFQHILQRNVLCGTAVIPSASTT